MSTPRKSIIDRILAPGQQAFFDSPGTSFAVIEADGPISIGFDEETPEPWDMGTGYAAANGESFRRLNVINRSTLANRVVIITAYGEFRDNRLNFVPLRNVGIPTLEAGTRVQGWAPGSIAAATAVTFTGLFTAPDKYRKALTISNEDSALKVQVRDPLGNVLLIVKAGDSAILPTSGEIQVYNPNGSAIQVRIGEIIYTQTA
jgi:hypothetical protein